MLVVGLTGGIASGKSTVSSLLKQHQIPLIDLDVLARVAVEPNSYALSALVSHFGSSILDPTTGTLNREKLGQIVFNDERERKVLNSIVHPAVRRLLVWELLKCWFRGEKMAVVDAPLLIEAGLWKFCGAIVVVYCSEILQIQRLRSRNSLDLASAQSRLHSQHPLSSKLPFADYVLDNSGSPTELSHQVDRLVSKLNQRVGKVSWIVSWLIPPVGIVRGLVTITWRKWIKKVGQDKGKQTRGERREEEIELRERRRK